MPEGPHNAPILAPGPDAAVAPRDPAGPRWTFSQRLALVYGAVSLVILLGAGLFTWWQASLLTERNEALAIIEARRLADRIGGVVTQARQGVALIASGGPQATGRLSCEARLVSAHLTMDSTIRHLFVVGRDQQVKCATLPAAVGRRVNDKVLNTAELTGRPAIGVIRAPEFGTGPIIVVAHPLTIEGRPDGVIGATLTLEEIRESVTAYRPEVAGLRAWLLDSAEVSAPLFGEDAMPALPPALHTSYIAPDRPEVGIASERGTVFIQAGAADDLTVVVALPEQSLRAGAPLRVALPPLLLALVLLGGMGALFWSVQRFIVAPLEAATRRLEAPDGALPSTEPSAATDVADLIRRLGATRATRDEAIRLRDILLREAHHRIKNHLALVASFLKLQERQLSDHAALQALRAAQGRMVAIGMTYELLHEGAGTEVALDQMLERFARALAARDLAEGNAAQVKVDLDPLEVPAEVAVRIALVVNELATNALKYAFVGRPPGTVEIVLRPEGIGGFSLRVTDDGSGASDGARRGLGLTVVDSLLRGIDARLERLPGPGTGYLIAWTPRPMPA